MPKKIDKAPSSSSSSTMSSFKKKKSPYTTKQGQQSTIQSKQGQQPTIQAKQLPVQLKQDEVVQRKPDITTTTKEKMTSDGISTKGHLTESDTIYKSGGPTDPFYLNKLQTDEDGKTSLKLGWGSAAHVVEVDGKYFLKKLFVGGSTYAPDKKEIQDEWGGVYSDDDSSIQISFPITSEGGSVQLSEVITFGVSTCSFSVISDEPLKNIILMHINNDQKMPFDKIYEKSKSFREGMDKAFVSMIDDKTEIDKVTKAASKAGIKKMDVLSRPYDIDDADRINLYTHHKVGVKLDGDKPSIFGEQGDSGSVIKAVISKVFAGVNSQIDKKTSFFTGLSETNARAIYKQLHDGLTNMDVEKIELTLQLLDWRVRLKKKGNIKESIERRTIMGVKAALENPDAPEVQEMKDTIRSIVDRNFKVGI